jgi:prephenate dehydrogenase
MNDQNILSEATITIVGLGLMGGSLAMALRGKCKMVIGMDTNSESITYALDHGIISRGSTKMNEIIQDANIIILAVPVGKILQIISELPTHHTGDAIVMDIGSTKKNITTALRTLPEQFDPIGGHPMCGKENLTIFNADPQLFKDAVFAISPLKRSSEKARGFACQLATAIGSHPMIIEPETHDHWTAATSHLPYLLSLALALSTPTEAAPLVGPGFRSTVRLAGTPSSMMLDILRTNRDEILGHCSNLISRLTEISDLIEASEFEKLSELMEKGKEKKEFFTSGGNR